MTWKISMWSADEGAGSIESHHFEAVPFGHDANVDGVTDFAEGEAVLVELSGSRPPFRVLSVRPMRQRQPAGTHWAGFDAINGAFSDVNIEECSDDALQFWFGDCCSHCTPHPLRVRFEGVTTVLGLDNDDFFSDPLFRLAAPAEVAEHQLVVPDGSTAFCIVMSHGQGPDGPLVLVVAREVAICS
jgi:hypothetical protein